MDDDISDFIENRLNDKYDKLKSSKKWLEKKLEYRKCYNSFSETLNQVQKSNLEQLIELKTILFEYERNFSYRLGASDLFKILKVLENL